MHHQNEFLVFVFLVIAIRTCHTYPRPQNVESPVVDVAKETEYEEHRDAELQESINGGQSGRALLFPYNGILAIELNDRPKRQDDEQATSIETTTEENAEEISKTKLPESYAGRFEGLNIGNILAIAGAKPQAFTRGEASYGRKRRNTEEKEEIIITDDEEDEDDVSESTTTEKTESKLPESYVGRFKGLNIANILSIAGAKPQAFTRGEASYGRKRRNSGDEAENVEAKNEEIPVAMVDQMTEIENVQTLWLEFLQHGISSRRKRQEEKREGKEITSDGENEEIQDSLAFQLEDIENVQALWLEFLQHGISSRRKRQEEAKEITENVEIPDAMVDQMTEIENVQTLWLEFLQHGISSRRKRQNLHFEQIEATTEDNQDKVDPNTNKIAVHPIQVKVKYWGETGIESQVSAQAGDNRRKKRQEAATQDNNDNNINAANTNKIAIPIQVKVKNWGETGIESQVSSQAGDNRRKKRQSLELVLEEDTEDNDENTKIAVPIQVKVKNWGETGIQSQNNVNNPRKKRKSLEFSLEEAIENESIMQEIFRATDDLNIINIPIKIVEVKNWGETGIQKPSESI